MEEMLVTNPQLKRVVGWQEASGLRLHASVQRWRPFQRFHAFNFHVVGVIEGRIISALRTLDPKIVVQFQRWSVAKKKKGGI